MSESRGGEAAGWLAETKGLSWVTIAWCIALALYLESCLDIFGGGGDEGVCSYLMS